MRHQKLAHTSGRHINKTFMNTVTQNTALLIRVSLFLAQVRLVTCYLVMVKQTAITEPQNRCKVPLIIYQYVPDIITKKLISHF